MNLTSQEFQSLDALLTVLTSPLPYFDLAPRVQRKNSRPGLLEIFAVCGNWYDVPHKASVMASAAKQRPSATLLLTGGRAERLTPPEAVKQGGEPLLLQNHLHQQYGLPKSRMAVYSGSRITNHNLLAMLMFAETTTDFERQPVSLTIYEEAFLVRREAAAMHALLQRPEAVLAAGSLEVVRFRPVGALTFRGLVETHGGRVEVALALVLGEIARLRSYSIPSNRSNEVVLPSSAAALDPGLTDAVDRIFARHRKGLLAVGKELLADPVRLWASGAAPRGMGRTGDEPVEIRSPRLIGRRARLKSLKPGTRSTW